MSKYSNNTPPDINGAIKWVYDRVEDGKILLDFGCSTGYFGAAIKQKGLRVYGAEISNDRFEAEKVLDGVYSFDLDQTWPDNVYERKYDYVLFGDVLEHTKDPTQVLKKTLKLLKKDGKIFVSIPNIAHMSVRLELLEGKFIYEPMGILDNTHLQYFTLETFKEVARNAGLEAELVDYTENDIPRDIYKKILDRVGVNASPRFWKAQFGLEARAYQYKFVLTRLGLKKVISKDIIKPLQYRDNIISDYQNQLDSLHNHSNEQAKIIDHYVRTCEKLTHNNRILERKLAFVKNPFNYTIQKASGIIKKSLKGIDWRNW